MNNLTCNAIEGIDNFFYDARTWIENKHAVIRFALYLALFLIPIGLVFAGIHFYHGQLGEAITIIAFYAFFHLFLVYRLLKNKLYLDIFFDEQGEYFLALALFIIDCMSLYIWITRGFSAILS